MKILITGAAGFVGRYLAKELAHAYRGADIAGAGIEDVSSDGIEGLRDYERFDITDIGQVRTLLKKLRPDLIFHLAALSSVAVSFGKPVETFHINQMGTLYLLESAVNDLAAGPKILLTGSADIYDVPGDGSAMTEETPFSPKNPYAVSKAAADYLGEFYFRNHELKVIRTRSFNHVGPGQAPTFVLPAFARQIALIEQGWQEPALTVGNLQAKRDFTNVRDVARAYRLLAQKGIPGEAYNVCSGTAYPIEDMLKKLLDLSSADIEVRIDPERMRKSENPVLLGDNAKLTAHTGWRPGIPLEQTLSELLDYWRERIKYE